MKSISFSRLQTFFKIENDCKPFIRFYIISKYLKFDCLLKITVTVGPMVFLITRTFIVTQFVREKWDFDNKKNVRNKSVSNRKDIENADPLR